MAKLPDKDSTVERIYRAWSDRQKNQPDKPWNEKGWRGHLGGSAIGKDCGRALWYGFHWAYPNEFPGRILRLFDTGHREEPRLIADLEAVGCTVFAEDPATGEQFRCSRHGGHFGGSLDALVLGVAEAPDSWHLGEFKTSNDRGFKALKKNGLIKEKPEHFAQMQVYMGEWNEQVKEAKARLKKDPETVKLTDLMRLKIGRLERAFYIARNKNTDELYSERIAFDSRSHAVYLKRAKTIIEATGPPGRISDDPTFYMCGWCEFKDICHNSGTSARFPSTNCRTCAHSTPDTGEDGAVWTCGKSGDPEPIGGEIAQFKGCEDHLFNPVFIPLKIAARDCENPAKWIAYEYGDRRFLNVTDQGKLDVGSYAFKLEFEHGMTESDAWAHLSSGQVAATSWHLEEGLLTELDTDVAILGIGDKGDA